MVRPLHRGRRLQKKMNRYLSASLHLVVCAGFANSALGARPFVTDDARVVDPGGCQVETFYKQQRAYDGSEFWFLPACNPGKVELTVGANRIEDAHNVVFQAKTLIKPLETNGYGVAASMGVFGGDPYVNGIASVSFLNDRAVVHTNLGMVMDNELNELRGTWGVGLEALLFAPKLYGILEVYGIKREEPTLHYGLRFWIKPNRFQIDATHGERRENDFAPAQRFNSVGLRILW